MGFKVEQFVKSVDNNLFCSICHKVFEDPVTCKDGHTFCKDCICLWLKTHRTCPMDNGSLAKKQLARILTVKGIINNLDVYCHPRTQDVNLLEVEDSGLKCDWVGKLQSLRQHRVTCPFQEVRCPHLLCKQRMQRRELENHKEICDFRRVGCEKCEMVLFQQDKEKHIKDDCLQAMICCPNQCGDEENQFVEQLKRIDLANHLSKVCRKALVNCPYEEQGCVVQIERQDVEKHIQENMAGHIMLLAKECSLLRERNKLLTDQCSIISLRCSTVTQMNSELKNELKKAKDDFEDALSKVQTYTWTVHDYPTLSKNFPNGSSFRSPNFWLSGHSWFMRLSPNGADNDSNGSMSLYLNLIQDDDQLVAESVAPCSELLVAFRVTLVSKQPDSISDFSMQGRNDFCKTTAKSWGWKKFKKAADVLSRAYCDGSLTIQCTLQVDKPQ